MMLYFLKLTTLSMMLVACEDSTTDTNDTDEQLADTDDTDDTDDTNDTDTEADTFSTLEGSATWNLEFDADAQAAGLTNCSYTRTYTGGFEDRSAPWLCPDCDVVYKADVSLEGLDCYEQVAGADVPAIEWVGHGNGAYFRTYFENARLSEQGAVVTSGDAFDVLNETEWYEHSEGGNFRFIVTGGFTTGTGQGDAFHGFAPPAEHACGWPTTSSELVLGKGPLEIGKPLPDGLFMDVCEEGVRLHDFEGKYLVIDVSAMDCGPCRSMAAEHGEFVTAMTEAGLDAEVITLLAPSLSGVLDTTKTSELQDWIDTYALHSPVLGDRGYGYWLLGESLGEEFGYPAWAVVAPDLEVIEVWKGFGGWEDISAIITEHAGQ
jgi:hypothetical protein